MKAEKPKVIATTASLFILVNSLSGIIGHLTKETVINEVVNYWFLFLFVLLGASWELYKFKYFLKSNACDNNFLVSNFCWYKNEFQDYFYNKDL